MSFGKDFDFSTILNQYVDSPKISIIEKSHQNSK